MLKIVASADGRPQDVSITNSTADKTIAGEACMTLGFARPKPTGVARLYQKG